ncbi:MAG TPA: hypothetical protein VFY54_21840 [Rubrobacter sp.]|nr:hypothetical protein [Rubrobacter sp.]
MAVNKEEWMETIENMTGLELSELVSALEERFGVSATAVAAAPAAGAAGRPASSLSSRRTRSPAGRPTRPGSRGSRSSSSGRRPLPSRRIRSPARS